MTKPTVRPGPRGVQALLKETYRVTHHWALLPGYRNLSDGEFPAAYLWPALGDRELSSVPLEGQEFLRFAGCESVGQVAGFVRGFGGTGLWGLFTDHVDRRTKGPQSLKVPLVVAAAGQTARRAFDLSRLGSPGYGEPLEDLAREAALLRAIIDAYQLAQEPPKLATTIRAWRRLIPAEGGHVGKAFEGRPVLGPLARAGFTLTFNRNRISFDLAAITGAASGLLFRFDPATIHPSREGLLEFVAAVMRPVVQLVRRTVVLRAGQLATANYLPDPPAMLPIMYLQAAETFGLGLSIRECKFERCPGPPERPRLFLFRTKLTGEPDGDKWRWKERSVSRQRYRAEDYCSAECATAASSARARGRPRSLADADRRRARKNR